MLENIVVATIKEWNISNYFILKDIYKDKYIFNIITNTDELTKENIKKLNPKYIFFPHWSWIIPEEIYNTYECIVFHMTDLPFGRGGSPFQNLIMRGVYDTRISALRVDGGLDSGAIYLKEDFNIAVGSAEENFIKLSNIIFNKMIPKFLDKTLTPIKQIGEVVTFKRRKPEDSNIELLSQKSIVKIYDFIRMLDADGYPKAFISLENFKIEFSEVHLKNNKLVGRFEVIEDE